MVSVVAEFTQFLKILLMILACAWIMVDIVRKTRG